MKLLAVLNGEEPAQIERTIKHLRDIGSAEVCIRAPLDADATAEIVCRPPFKLNLSFTNPTLHQEEFLTHIRRLPLPLSNFELLVIVLLRLFSALEKGIHICQEVHLQAAHRRQNEIGMLQNEDDEDHAQEPCHSRSLSELISADLIILVEIVEHVVRHLLPLLILTNLLIRPHILAGDLADVVPYARQAQEVVDEELHKYFVVVVAHAVSEPRTVVVHPHDAPAADGAVVGARRLQAPALHAVSV